MHDALNFSGNRRAPSSMFTCAERELEIMKKGLSLVRACVCVASCLSHFAWKLVYLYEMFLPSVARKNNNFMTKNYIIISKA